MFADLEELSNQFESRPLIDLTDIDAIRRYNEWLRNVNSLLDIVLKYN
jgi:hypothetical protein